MTPVLSSLATVVGLPLASVNFFGGHGWLLERARDAHAEHAFLVVVEDDFVIQRLSVVMRSIVREVLVARGKTNACVPSAASCLFGNPVLVSTSSCLCRCRSCAHDFALEDVAHFVRRLAVLMAVELFQKSRSFTLP